MACAAPAAQQPPFRETEEYEQLAKKTNQDDFSRIVFLMNYYRKAPFTIVFDGSDYTPEFAFPFAQVYLFAHYKQEKAPRWIKKHCYRSPFKQNIIYVRYPDGRYETARELILRDLALLDKALREDKNLKAKGA